MFYSFNIGHHSEELKDQFIHKFIKIVIFNYFKRANSILTWKNRRHLPPYVCNFFLSYMLARVKFFSRKNLKMLGKPIFHLFMFNYFGKN